MISQCWASDAQHSHWDEFRAPSCRAANYHQLKLQVFVHTNQQNTPSVMFMWYAICQINSQFSCIMRSIFSSEVMEEWHWWDTVGGTGDETPAGSLLAKSRRLGWSRNLKKKKRCQTDSQPFWWRAVFAELAHFTSILQFTPSAGKREWNAQWQQKALDVNMETRQSKMEPDHWALNKNTQIAL